MMRSFDYARTAPEPLEGALVFAVRLVVAFMGRLMLEPCAVVNGVWEAKSARMAC
jgi:hypothetical protein